VFRAAQTSLDGPNARVYADAPMRVEEIQNLPRVSHEHHDRLWHYVEQLDALADRLSSDSLDTTRLIEELPDLRELHDGLTRMLIPHMETVEAAVYPTLERLLADSHTTAPMAIEHIEIRRLVGAMAILRSTRKAMPTAGPRSHCAAFSCGCMLSSRRTWRRRSYTSPSSRTG
jgi:hypothetical protein